MARAMKISPSVIAAALTCCATAQATGFAKTAGEKVAGQAGAARAKVGEALHDHVPGMRVKESNGPAADSGNGRYAQSPGAADSPPEG